MFAQITKDGPTDQRQILHPSMACTMLGVGMDKLNSYVRKGLLIPIFTSGGHRRFRTEDIRALLDGKRKQEVTPEIREAIRLIVRDELSAKGQRPKVQVTNLKTLKTQEFDNFTEACRSLGWNRGSAWYSVKRNPVYRDHQVTNAFTS